MTLGGNVCVRNGIELDFCFREAIQSLLPVCDEVVVCDGESTDGTQELIRDWITHEPKIKICVYKWPNPKGDPDFWVKWLNYAREHVRSTYTIQLDADEVLSENSYGIIQQYKQRPAKPSFALWCRRYNFWSDHKHLIPHGVCCSHRVVRFAPQHIWMPSDGSHPRGAQLIRLAKPSSVEIFHYGFIRKREAFFKKERALHNMFFASYDPRLEEAEKYEGNWATMPGLCDWENKLVPYIGGHPRVMAKWLKERGYE